MDMDSLTSSNAKKYRLIFFKKKHYIKYLIEVFDTTYAT